MSSKASDFLLTMAAAVPLLLCIGINNAKSDTDLSVDDAREIVYQKLISHVFPEFHNHIEPLLDTYSTDYSDYGYSHPAHCAYLEWAVTHNRAIEKEKGIKCEQLDTLSDEVDDCPALSLEEKPLTDIDVRKSMEYRRTPWTHSCLPTNSLQIQTKNWRYLSLIQSLPSGEWSQISGGLPDKKIRMRIALEWLMTSQGLSTPEDKPDDWNRDLRKAVRDALRPFTALTDFSDISKADQRSLAIQLVEMVHGNYLQEEDIMQPSNTDYGYPSGYAMASPSNAPPPLLSLPWLTLSAPTEILVLLSLYRSSVHQASIR